MQLESVASIAAAIGLGSGLDDPSRIGHPPARGFARIGLERASLPARTSVSY